MALSVVISRQSSHVSLKLKSKASHREILLGNQEYISKHSWGVSQIYKQDLLTRFVKVFGVYIFVFLIMYRNLLCLDAGPLSVGSKVFHHDFLQPRRPQLKPRFEFYCLFLNTHATTNIWNWNPLRGSLENPLCPLMATVGSLTLFKTKELEDTNLTLDYYISF